MSQRLFFSGLIVLFVLSLLPLSASANTTILQPGTLIKGSSQSVYYYGADGKRYVFPNENTYKTWFINFNVVVSIGDQILGEVPIGGNVTYKPGKKMVKITTDPKVYYVDANGTLRHITSEQLAKALYGDNWSKLVDDVPDAFFINYKVGLPLTEPDVTTVTSDYSINEDKLLSDQADPTPSDIGKIDLSGAISGSSANLNWTTSNLNADQGFKVVMGNEPYPVYPGNDYHYLSDAGIRTDTWNDLSSGTYYFRVCQYLGGKCGVYSNQLILKVGTGTTTPATDKKITLTASVSYDVVKLNWTPSFTSSQGYKIVKAEHSNPIYPGDDYHYLSTSTAKSDSWENLSAGTYHFRVCEYLGGKCGVYSNDVSITIGANDTQTTTKKITLLATTSNNITTIKWSANFTSSQGFKVIKAEHSNPVYPGDDYHYLSSASATTDTWENLSNGTYHFRVCEYLGGKCGVYSNDLTVIIGLAERTNTSNGSISLSGNVNGDTIYLNWILTDMTSSMGFKVVKADEANPVYPGNEYHYYSDPNLRADSWEGLTPGTYHFRVCQYLGSYCGVYSNDLALTVQ